MEQFICTKLYEHGHNIERRKEIETSRYTLLFDSKKKM